MSFLIILTGALFLALCHQFFHLDMVGKRIEKQREIQYFSALFADEFRMCSDEMTRMARAYIASGDSQYLARFNKVHDIHDGTAPRDDKAYLSTLSVFREQGTCPEPFDKPMSFMGIARNAGFTEREYALLEKADAASGRLHEKAFIAIRQVQQHPGSPEERLKSLSMLANEKYDSEREEVMKLIHDFQHMVADRTGALIAEGESVSQRIRDILIGLVLLFSVAAFGGMICECFRADRLKDSTRKDPLTQVASRSHLLEHLGKATLNAEARGEIVLLAFVDLNGFKPINDRYGHKRGDQLLKLVADSLHAQCRESDLVARYGGDEFVIVFVSAMKHREESILRMRTTIEDAFREVVKDGVGSCVGAAAGISVFPCPAPTVDELVRTADKAMYRAKARGERMAIEVYGVENSLAYVDSNVVLKEEDAVMMADTH